MSENRFHKSRFTSGALLACIVGVLSLISASFIFGGHARIPIVIAPEVVNAPPSFPCTSDADDCTTARVYGHLASSFIRAVVDAVIPPERIYFAWFTRLQLMVISIVAGVLYFRRYLLERNREDEKPNRKLLYGKLNLFTPRAKDHTSLQHVRSNLLFYTLPLFIAAIFLTYLVSSAGALLLSVMFRGLAFTPIQAVMVSVVLGAIIAYGLVHWLSAANTRDLLNLCLIVIAVGLGGSFFVSSNPKWWEEAISTTGIDSVAAPLLTLTLVSLSLILILLMRDVANIFKALFDNLDVPSKPSTIQIERIFAVWILAFLLIAFIGIFPNVKSIVWINRLHMFGAVGSALLLIVAGKGWFTLVMARRLLPPFFRWATGFLIVADEVFISLFMFKGVNLTALELWLLASIGIWFYSLTAIGLELIDDLEAPNLDHIPMGERPLQWGFAAAVVLAVIVGVLASIIG